jgi:hypothetical protein
MNGLSSCAGKVLIRLIFVVPKMPVPGRFESDEGAKFPRISRLAFAVMKHFGLVQAIARRGLIQ